MMDLNSDEIMNEREEWLCSDSPKRLLWSYEKTFESRKEAIACGKNVVEKFNSAKRISRKLTTELSETFGEEFLRRTKRKRPLTSFAIGKMVDGFNVEKIEEIFLKGVEK